MSLEHFRSLNDKEKDSAVAEILTAFYHIMTSMKIYHWSTNFFSRHKATDNFGITIQPLFDQFFEVLFGIYPSVKKNLLKHNDLKIKVSRSSENTINLKADDMYNKLDNFKKFMQSLDSVFEGHTDLLNIRDEINGLTEQTQYLFGFQ